MFYKLKPNYILRGWEGTAWVLVQRPKNWSRMLSAEEFQTLMLCDGETDLPDDLLDETIGRELKQLGQEGIIEASAVASPLDPEQYYKYYHNRYVRRVFGPSPVDAISVAGTVIWTRPMRRWENSPAKKHST